MNALQVNFHQHPLYIIEHNGEPYTPMKPIVDGMGIDWRSQQRKLSENADRFGMVKLTIPVNGVVSMQEMLCLPLRKLFGWLCTISPKKVKPELKDKILQYQNECDEVLYRHWTNRNRPQAPESIDDVILIDVNGWKPGIAFKIEGDTWVPEKFMHRLFCYSTPRAFKKMYMTHRHLLPKGSVHKVDIDSDVGIGELKGHLIFNLKAISILVQKSGTCPRLSVIQWVVEQAQTLPIGNMLIKEDLVKSLRGYTQLGKKRLIEMEGSNIDTGKIHDVVMDTAFLVSAI